LKDVYYEVKETCNNFPEIELNNVKKFGGKINVFYTRRNKLKRFSNEHKLYYSLYENLNTSDVDIFELTKN
jgi:hypothetical protein